MGEKNVAYVGMSDTKSISEKCLCCAMDNGFNHLLRPLRQDPSRRWSSSRSSSDSVNRTMISSRDINERIWNAKCVAWRGVPRISDIIFERERLGIKSNLPILETRGCGIVLDNAKRVKLFPGWDESFCVCFSHGCIVFKGVWIRSAVVIVFVDQ
jgi:hypothetical protein